MNAAFNDFESAGHAVLAHLHQRLGFSLWMLTRIVGEERIVLQVADHGYGVAAGSAGLWADSLCSAMVEGKGPRVAPDSDLVPAYASARVRQRVPIKAYIGVPLTNADGSLFGTLCAIDPATQPAALAEEQGLVELLAGLLSSLLQAELRAADESRRSERLRGEAQSDSLTRLLNRRGWDELMAKEEDRCRRHGHPAALIAIDLDGLKQVNDTVGHAAGDALIARAAQALRHAVRESDILARVGGDEFGVIAVECSQEGADALAARARRALDDQGVRASIGVALREPPRTLEAAWSVADHRMYEAKRAAQQRRQDETVVAGSGAPSSV